MTCNDEKKLQERKGYLVFISVSGFIGQLNLVIPYANPNTQPWVIKIRKLCLVLNPDSEVNILLY